MKIFLTRAVKSHFEMLLCQPLGIMYLASVLQEQGHDVRIFDFKLGSREFDKFREAFINERPDVVGISAMTYEAENLHEISRTIKSIYPKTLVVTGGAHTSSFAEKVLEDKNVDFVITGEGEHRFVSLLDTLSRGGELNSLDGAGYREKGETVVHPGSKYISDLDTLPFPAWDLIDVEAYWSKPRSGIIYKYKEYMALFTSRSCPYKCIYCNNIFGKQYRMRSAKNVLNEMESLQKQFGVREFLILDDNFNLSLKRTKEFCKGVLSRELKAALSFPNGLRGDLLDEEAIDLLKQAGMFRVQYSVETSSPRMQKYIQKNINIKKIDHVFRVTSRAGIMTHGVFMLGFPTETKEEMLQTIRWAIRSPAHTAVFNRVIPFGNTRLAEIAKEQNPDLAFDFTHFQFYTHQVNISDLSDIEITRLQRSAYLRFYLNPIRIIRIVLCTPNKSQLFKLIGVFFSRVITGK